MTEPEQLILILRKNGHAIERLIEGQVKLTRAIETISRVILAATCPAASPGGKSERN